MTEEQKNIIRIMKLLGQDGFGPTVYEWNSSDIPGRPGQTAVRNAFSGRWANAVTAAGLTPRPRGRRDGAAAHIPTMTEIDAALFAELGWSPTDPQSMNRMAYLPSEGLPVSPPKVKPIWDWHRMAYIKCEVYQCR